MSSDKIRLAVAAYLCLGLPLAVSAHPMGNFSVNHYSRLNFGPRGAELTYVLDLAEIPAFQLLGQWQIDWKDPGQLSQQSQQQAKEWLDNVVVTQANQRVPLRLVSVSPAAVEGAGGMPVLRISITGEAVLQPGDMAYEDRNFPGRAGWKEIVVDHDRGVRIQSSSQGNQDLSKALTYYPPDPSLAPPQDVTARVSWFPGPISNSAPAIGPVTTNLPAAPQARPAEAPLPVAPPASFSQQQPDSPGAVVRGDFLSRMLQKKELSGGLILIGVLVAFGLGAMHAMSPGHGKTIVAAYLVGNRGTLKHAGLLGLVVTFTHTFTVFLLGLGILFFQQYVVPEKIVPVLGAISGLSIVSIGVMLLYQRAKALMEGSSDHGHTHSHEPAPRPGRTRIAELREAQALADHVHDDHSHHPNHTHQHASGLVHTHGGSTHSHAIEGEITPGSLIALGISGGLVPCPSALILMLSAIALGHPGVGLVLLIGFSTGLALVLMAFGMLALYARHLLPSSQGAMNKPLVRLVPVFSAVVVICLGLAMTAVSTGWIQPMRFLS